MKPERLMRRWRRRHRQLVGTLPLLLRRARKRGEGEDVHQLRVVLRRLRLSVRLGKGEFGEESVARLRAWAATVSHATSPVRDLDIAIEWLRAAKASPALVQECEQVRDRVWRRRQPELRPLPRGLLVPLASPGRSAKAESRIRRRQRRLEARYREQLRRELPVFFRLSESERHEFRRVVRWWRYLRELALPKRKLSKDPRLRALFEVQEALGGIQNLALVDEALRKLTPSEELGELKRLLSRQQQIQVARARQSLSSLRSKL